MADTVLHARAVQALYVAYFGRPADPAGLAHWAGVLAQHHGDLGAIRAGFSGSSEYRATYSGLDAAATVNEMYRHLFGREAERDGLAYWSQALAAGAVSIDLLLETMAGSAQGSDLAALTAKVDVADRFTQALATSGRSGSYDAAQIAAAKALLATVTDAASAARAIQSIEASTPPVGTDGDDTFYLLQRPPAGEPPLFNGGNGNDKLHLGFTTSELGIAWPAGGTAPRQLSISLPDSSLAGEAASLSRGAYFIVDGVESFVFKDGQVLSRADLDLVLAKLRPLQLATLAEGLYQAGFGDMAIGGGTAVVRGTAAADTLAAGAAAAYLFGDAGDDRFVMGADAGQASHLLFGGLGNNSADYSAATGPVTVEHGYSARGVLQHWNSYESVVRNGAAVDRLFNMQALTGSAHGDAFYLDASSTLTAIDGGAGQDSATINLPLARLDILFDSRSGLELDGVVYKNVETFSTADGFTFAAADLLKVADDNFNNRSDAIDRLLDQGLPLASSVFKIERGGTVADTFTLDANATLYFGGSGADNFIAGSGKEKVTHYLMGGMDLGNSVSYAAAAGAIVYANTWYEGKDVRIAGLRTVINGNSVDYLSHVDRITGSSFDDRFYVELADAPKYNPSMIDGGAGIDTLVLQGSYQTHDLYKTANGGLRYGDLAEIRNVERIANSAGLGASVNDVLKTLDLFDGGHARLDDLFKKMQALGMTVTTTAPPHGFADLVGLPEPAWA